MPPREGAAGRVSHTGAAAPRSAPGPVPVPAECGVVGAAAAVARTRPVLPPTARRPPTRAARGSAARENDAGSGVGPLVLPDSLLRLIWGSEGV